MAATAAESVNPSADPLATNRHSRAAAARTRKRPVRSGRGVNRCGSSPKLLPEQRLDLGGIGDGRAEVVRKTEEVVKINVAVGHDVVRGVVPFLTVG